MIENIYFFNGLIGYSKYNALIFLIPGIRGKKERGKGKVLLNIHL